METSAQQYSTKVSGGFGAIRLAVAGSLTIKSLSNWHSKYSAIEALNDLCAHLMRTYCCRTQDGRKCLIASRSLPQVLHARQSSYHVQAVAPARERPTGLVFSDRGRGERGRAGRSQEPTCLQKTAAAEIPESLVSQVLLASLSDDRFGAPIVVPCSRHNRSQGENQKQFVTTCRLVAAALPAMAVNKCTSPIGAMAFQEAAVPPGSLG